MLAGSTLVMPSGLLLVGASCQYVLLEAAWVVEVAAGQPSGTMPYMLGYYWGEGMFDSMGHLFAVGLADRPMLAENSMDYFEFGFASDMPLNLDFVVESLCNQDVAAGSPCPAV